MIRPDYLHYGISLGLPVLLEESSRRSECRCDGGIETGFQKQRKILR